jgi:hypothetical protein
LCEDPQIQPVAAAQRSNVMRDKNPQKPSRHCQLKPPVVVTASVEVMPSSQARHKLELSKEELPRLVFGPLQRDADEAALLGWILFWREEGV